MQWEVLPLERQFFAQKPKNTSEMAKILASFFNSVFTSDPCFSELHIQGVSKKKDSLLSDDCSASKAPSEKVKTIF